MTALEDFRGTRETRENPAASDTIRPDFIIIGAMKCGTTTLFRHLGKHPEIGLSQDKETDFFLAEQNFARGTRRPLPPVGDALRGALRDALAQDAAAFRSLTGQDFAHWSV